MSTHVCIEYANPQNLSDSITVNFKLYHSDIVNKWVQQVALAQSQYHIDHPDRFYGFTSIEVEIARAIYSINECVDVINSHGHIITRKVASVYDYDTLNYLHHIFEVYHGLLNQQTHEFYLTAPESVQQALANLNLLVHRCESASRGSTPRHVVTYYGLPKTQELTLDDYVTMTDSYVFGGVYLQYAEIGKTLEDLAMDRDQYISDDAFKPMRHFSADFTVRYSASDTQQVSERRVLVDQYYHEHCDFFQSRGLSRAHEYLKTGRIPLAQIDTTDGHTKVLSMIATRQYVKSVNFI